MNKRMFWGVCSLVVILSLPAYSKFARRNIEDVPIERLVSNLHDYLKEHPKEAEAHYTFGRVCSMAYARNTKTLPADIKGWDAKPNPYPKLDIFDRYPKQEALPSSKEKPTSAKLQYLHLAIKHYHIATTLKSDDEYAWLGYAWTVEQGSLFADKLPAPFDSKKRVAGKIQWREEALKAYRKVYKENAVEGKRGNMSFPDPAVEAGESILRIQKTRTALLNAEEKAEVATITQSLPDLRKRPGYITPIIFPLSTNTSFQHLTSTSKRVSFDLMGDGILRKWSWVTPDAGLLVWNPKRTQRITSGYQLFGTVTWCIIWKNGYEPLARLDNDHNGWLEGRELEGIGVWQDKNGNGKCEAGEVKTLNQLGIVRIAVRGQRNIEGVLTHPQGIIKRDGTILPTYDWIAKTQ